MFWAKIRKISEFFIWKFSFLVVKFSIYLNRRVFVMTIATDKAFFHPKNADISYFFTKTFVVGNHKRLGEALLMSTICFCREIRKILFGYPLLSVAMLEDYASFFTGGVRQLLWLPISFAFLCSKFLLKVVFCKRKHSQSFLLWWCPFQKGKIQKSKCGRVASLERNSQYHVT